MTLTEFLDARLAEDDEVAEADLLGDYIGAGRWAREVEAKRAILELHRSGDAWCDHCSGWYGADPGADCPNLRRLAAVYADHPDYRKEWRA